MASALETVRMTIKGDKKLLRALDELSRNGARRAARSALIAGNRPVVAAIRAAVKSKTGKVTGKLAKAVGAHAKKSRKTGEFRSVVGLNVGKKLAAQAPHAHLVALGSKRRKTEAGANRGRMPAHDLLPSAVAACKSQSMAAMKAKLLERIKIEAAKARRK